MVDDASPDSREQQRVDEYFTERATYWRELYEGSSVESAIFRARQDQAMAWASAAWTPGARALDVGCGAGLLTVALAELGFQVDAIDSSEGMIQTAARQLASAPAEVAARVTLAPGDVYDLPWPDDTFDLVTALGVIPWLDDPRGALGELRRVLRPGGRLVVTSDNRARLTHLIDPLWNPHLTGPRRRLGRALRGAGLRTASEGGLTEHLYTPSQFDELLASAGLVALERTTVGFGRFTFLNRSLLGDGPGGRLHERLQRRAKRAGSHLCRRGNHDMALVTKESERV